MPEQCCILINEIDWYLAISYLEVARKFIDIDLSCLIQVPGTFKRKTRKIVLAAYEDRFVVSPKQTATFDKWNRDGVEKEDDDVTTEEEDNDDYYYGSDGYES